MALRRSLTTRARVFAQQRFASSFSYLDHEDKSRNHHLDRRSYGNSNTRLGVRFRDPRWSTSGFMLARNMSTSGDGDGDWSDLAVDKTMEVVSPALNEVAVAAADSWPPVAALQYAIAEIHNLTGFNWWASIAITTIVLRTLALPISINQMKAVLRLNTLRPQLDQIIKEMNDTGNSPSAGLKCQERTRRVLKEHGVSPSTPLKGLLIQGPIFVGSFLAIQNMAEKVPSFKNGGVSWFLDLTTADPFYVLPCLTAFLFWITIEFNMREGFEGKVVKNVLRAFAALTVPLTASFPKALFCYWITSNLFSLVYGLIIKQHPVKKLLNIPIRVPPPTSQIITLSTLVSQSITSPTLEEHKSTNQRVSSSTVLSRRIKTLEKQVKKTKKIKNI